MTKKTRFVSVPFRGSRSEITLSIMMNMLIVVVVSVPFRGSRSEIIYIGTPSVDA